MDIQPITDANGNTVFKLGFTLSKDDMAALVAAVAALPQPTPSPTPTPVPVPTPTQQTGFRGVYAFNNMANTSLFSDNPSIAGTVLTRYWAEIEPRQGQYNWALIDNDMKAWIAAGKAVIIRVSTSGWKNWQPSQNSVQGTPQWVYDLGVKHVKDDDGSIKPEYWNPIFLSNLANFIHAFAQRYDSNPNITCIEMGIGDGGESKVDTSKASDVLSLWKAIGYTDALWFGAIQKIITSYTSSFTKTPLVLMPDATFIGGSSGYNEQKLIDYIKSLNNKNIWVQDNGLIGGKSLPSSLASLPKGWPLLSEQRNDTATSGTTLESDLSTAMSQGAVAILVFSSDIQNTKNAATLAKYAAMVGK
jgi:hypothetical protein